MVYRLLEVFFIVQFLPELDGHLWLAKRVDGLVDCGFGGDGVRGNTERRAGRGLVLIRVHAHLVDGVDGLRGRTVVRVISVRSHFY